MIKIETAQRIAELLNELLEMDGRAVAALISSRVPCNEILGR